MNIRIILRRLFQFRLNPIVIMVSLAIGIACINLISLFVFRELRTDDFHANSDRIYALTTNDPWQPGQKEYFCRFGSAEYIEQNLAPVEDFCRVRYSSCLQTVVNNISYEEAPKVIEATPNFFDFFSWELLTKNPATALESADNVVISKELAEKYFGSGNPVGQIIRIVSGGSKADLVVSGVFRSPQQNSQLSFDMVRKIGEADSPCYLRLSEGTTKEEVEALLAENLKAIPTMHDKEETTFYLASLRDVYFDPIQKSKTELNRDIGELWLALGIGLLILLIAVVNYLGLVSNNLQEKQKEYAIRLINGSSKFRLLADFAFENSLYLGISFLLSIGLMIWAFPFFNSLVRTNLEPAYLFHPAQIGLLIGSVVLIGLIGQLFAHFKIRSGITSAKVVAKETPAHRNTSFSLFNVLQLTATLILIVSSVVIVKQIRYISEKPIGIDREVVEIKLPPAYFSIVNTFRDELKKNALISKVSVVNTSPVLDHWMIELRYTRNGKELSYTPAGFEGDENYIETLGITILEGEDFSRIAPNDGKCLINQTLARLFPGENLIGRNLPGSDRKVIGRVEDFHYDDLKNYVGPAVIWYNREGSYLLAKPVEGQLAAAMNIIEEVWQKLIPDYPINIQSVRDRYEWLHRENKKFVQLISACSLISIFLSMIGLFAIAVDRSNQRIKEIGIRKVNGAKIKEVLVMLNRDFLTWVIIAFVVATPVAWILMNKWLENFAYKTPLSWWIFGLSGFMALAITLITVSWQSWRVASQNPVEALRYE